MCIIDIYHEDAYSDLLDIKLERDVAKLVFCFLVIWKTVNQSDSWLCLQITDKSRLKNEILLEELHE